MGNWRWSRFEGVSVPALVVCLIVIGAFLVLGVLWVRKPQARRRGIVTLSVVLIPIILSAVVLGFRAIAW